MFKIQLPAASNNVQMSPVDASVQPTHRSNQFGQNGLSGSETQHYDQRMAGLIKADQAKLDRIKFLMSERRTLYAEI